MTVYVILPDELFNSHIPDFVKSQMGYPENYLVSECIFGEPKQLENNSWLCDARFRSYYYDKPNGIDVLGISNNCTNRELHDEEIEQWKQIIGEENVITDIEGLNFKSIDE